MKIIKNIYLFLLFLLFLLTPLLFAACTGGGDEIKAIRDRGVLRVGVKVDVPRFGYLNPETNEMEGAEIDLSRIIADEILDDKNAVRFVNLTAQTRGPMLDNGEIDLVIATFTITEERKLSFNFSRPYYTDELGYLVRGDASITRPEDLDGKAIGVVQASTAKTALEDEFVNMGVDASLREYSSYPEVKAALIGGDVDAFVTDKSILYGYLDDGCALLDAGFNPQQYGIASKSDNDKLAGRVDSLLETLEKNGELAAILKKWEL